MSVFASVSKQGPSATPLEQYLESFATELLSLGYAAMTVKHKRATAKVFARWLAGENLGVANINDTTIEAFLRCSGGDRSLISNRPYTLASFLRHLRSCGAVPHPKPPAREQSYGELLQERYQTYLRSERGLAEETIAGYGRYASEFIRRHFEATPIPPPGSMLDASAVRDFLLKRTQTLAPTTAQGIATALRSLLRFLFLEGETVLDLSLAIPPIRAWRRAGVHGHLSQEEVELLLKANDRDTPSGLRDYAILLLLARLGLRAGEVAYLELGDVSWRRSEIALRGKGQTLQHLPLLKDVGEALARYLLNARPKSNCRRVFLRNDAPRIGLTPDGIGCVVRRALERAKLKPPRRGSHLLRFSLATTMIRRGAKMTEIAEVLRHRSHETTEIYAKVDFSALRSVALPWTAKAGER